MSRIVVIAIIVILVIGGLGVYLSGGGGNGGVPSTFLINPTNSATITDKYPTFEWSCVSGVVSYRLLVDNDHDFSSPEVDCVLGGSDNVYTIPRENPIPLGKYWWKVIATTESAENSSDVWKFWLAPPYPEPQETNEVKVIIGGSRDDAFSATFKNGVLDAAGYLNLNPTFYFENWDDSHMTTTFKNTVSSGPMGVIVMGHPGSSPLGETVGIAVEENDVIITIANVPLPSVQNEYSYQGVGYAGEDPYQMGKKLATEALNRAGSVSNALVWGLKSKPGRGQRSQGAEDSLSNAGVSVTYQEISQGVLDDPYSASMDLSGYDLVIVDYGKLLEQVPGLTGSGSAYIAGFDLTSGMIPSIRNGDIDLVLDTHPYLQGFMSTVQVALDKFGKFRGIDVPTGYTFVDGSNIDAHPTEHCGYTLSSLIDGGIRGMGSSHTRIDFSDVSVYFVPGGPSGGVFNKVLTKGGGGAASDFGANITVDFSDWNPTEILNDFDSGMSMVPDGIVVNGTPGEVALEPHVEDAKNSGIITTIVNVELPGLESKYKESGLGYVGQDLWESGYMLAQNAVEDAGLQPGDLVFLWGLKTRPGRRQRTLGAEAALLDAGMDVHYDEIDPTTDMDPSAGLATLTGWLSGHPSCKMVMTDHGGLTATLGTFLMAQYGEDTEAVYGAGFDLSGTTINAIQTGWVDLTLDQQPYLQGYFGVLQVLLTEEGGFPGLHISTGAALIDEINAVPLKELAVDTIR